MLIRVRRCADGDKLMLNLTNKAVMAASTTDVQVPYADESAVPKGLY